LLLLQLLLMQLQKLYESYKSSNSTSASANANAAPHALFSVRSSSSSPSNNNNRLQLGSFSFIAVAISCLRIGLMLHCESWMGEVILDKIYFTLPSIVCDVNILAALPNTREGE
jgi:hypothetical protein